MNQLTQNQKDEQLRMWAEQIHECRTSGKTVPVWCNENGITEHSYYYRLRKVTESTYEQIPVAVARIPSETPSHSEGQPSVTVRTASMVVEISNTASDEMIGAILRALKC